MPMRRQRAEGEVAPVSETSEDRPEGQPPPAGNRYEIVFEASGVVGKPEDSEGEQE